MVQAPFGLESLLTLMRLVCTNFKANVTESLTLDYVVCETVVTAAELRVVRIIADKITYEVRKGWPTAHR